MRVTDANVATAPGLSSMDVIRMVPGLTYRQLDHWVRRGYITPLIQAQRSGERHRFTANQAVRIASVVDALDALGSDHIRRLFDGEISVTRCPL